MHALIIEDEFLIAYLIEERLRNLGYTSFSFAMDEDEAVLSASAQCPDLITCEARLTSGCGISAVQRICSQKPVPVLYIVGSEGTVRERCPQAIVIQKPFSVSELKQGIHDACRAA